MDERVYSLSLSLSLDALSLSLATLSPSLMQHYVSYDAEVECMRL
jgi:hypothetical protein